PGAGELGGVEDVPDRWRALGRRAADSGDGSRPGGERADVDGRAVDELPGGRELERNAPGGGGAYRAGGRLRVDDEPLRVVADPWSARLLALPQGDVNEDPARDLLGAFDYWPNPCGGRLL